jgi:hypothetical protein
VEVLVEMITVGVDSRVELGDGVMERGVGVNSAVKLWQPDATRSRTTAVLESADPRQ